MPRPRSPARVAIVGAGVAGLACARTLVDHGVDVVVFDKGQRPGGRLAGHLAPGLEVDLGAQYVTVRDARFASHVRSWRAAGVVARWDGRICALPDRGGALVDTPALERLVGAPSMNAIAAALGRDLDVRSSHRVDELARCGAGFTLAGTVASGVTLGPRAEADEGPRIGFGAFDAVLVCLPPEQVHPLVRAVSPGLAATVAQVASVPCVALGFAPAGDALRGLPFDGLFVGRDDDDARVLSWVARDSSKPGRPGGERWVVHAAPAWSRHHLRDPCDVIERALLGELARTFALPPLEATTSTVRRWALARAPAPLTALALFDQDGALGIGGDWTAGGRVEGAFVAGVALAERVLGVARGRRAR